MTRRTLKILVAGFLAVVVLLLVVGQVLHAAGVDVLCISNENGRWRLIRCVEETAFMADTAPTELSADAQPVLIDTDMAADDWMAIQYLLGRHDVDVRAITVTGAGEAHCGPGVQNALDLVALASRPEIPVTCGREAPLAGDHAFPQSWRTNVDALAGISLPRSPREPHGQDAVDLIRETVRDAGGNLEIIALGPLTNLAGAFLDDPSLAEQVEGVYIMGGAFAVPGNLNDAPEMGVGNVAAEWNIYVDPHAAALVVASGAPVTFVPLDASNHVPLDEEFYHRLGEDRTTPEAEFVYQVLTRNIGFVRSGEYYFWDPLTAAIAVDESLGTFETQPVAVIEGGGPESGATRVDERGDPVRIATAADGDGFRQVFLDVLNGRAAK
jgi:inosine-uridine nucleoside N-ribohydrolase